MIFLQLNPFADREVFSGRIYKRVDRSAQDVFIQCFLAECCYKHSCFSHWKGICLLPLMYSRIPLAIFF